MTTGKSKRIAATVAVAVPLLVLIGFIAVRYAIRASRSDPSPAVSFAQSANLQTVDATTCGLQTELVTISWENLGSEEARVAVVQILGTDSSTVIHTFVQEIGSAIAGTMNVNYTFYSTELIGGTQYSAKISIVSKSTYESNPSAFTAIVASATTVTVNKSVATYVPTPQPADQDLGTIHAYEHCGNTKSIVVSLDDGPATELAASQRILDLMKEYHPDVKLTFFVSPTAYGASSMAQRCDILSNMIEDGHDVESHSWTHANFTKSYYNNIPGMIDELDHVRSWIQCCSPIPDYNVTIFRPPFGELAVPLARVATKIGYSMAFWNHDLFDYLYFDQADPIGQDSKLQSMLSALNASLPAADSERDMVILAHDRNIYQVRAIIEVVSLLKQRLPNHKFVSAKECWDSCVAKFGGALCNDPYNFPTTDRYAEFLSG